MSPCAHVRVPGSRQNHLRHKRSRLTSRPRLYKIPIISRSKNRWNALCIIKLFLLCRQQGSQCPIAIGRTDLNDPITFYIEKILRKSNSKEFFNQYVAGITVTDAPLVNGKNISQPSPPVITSWFSNQVSK